ncbi:response regulator [Egicoccus sp. AB-alg2]|uniref:response regulator n=1 Tax=Egicoccus sp. AB-alg2 TaxID=3242693 RepID=UPI00359E89F8
MTDVGPTAVSSTTVLVVDDDAMVRDVTSLILRHAGYDVVLADNGRQAVDLVRERGGSVDVVLLDVMMPEMTGHDAFPRLREAEPDLPVVFFSGFDQSEVADHLAGAGAYTSFIAKPYRNDELCAEIARAAASRQTDDTSG